jgi:hypothetical protein
MEPTGPRKYASDCLRLARLAKGHDERVLMIRLAARWALRAEDFAEGSGADRLSDLPSIVTTREEGCTPPAPAAFPPAAKAILRARPARSTN